MVSMTIILYALIAGGSSRTTATDALVENTWKCGELKKLYFSPSAGGLKERKKEKLVVSCSPVSVDLGARVYNKYFEV